MALNSQHSVTERLMNSTLQGKELPKSTGHEKKHLNDVHYTQWDYSWKYYPRNVREKFDADYRSKLLETPELRQLLQKKKLYRSTYQNPLFNAGVLGALLLSAGITSPRFSSTKLLIAACVYTVYFAYRKKEVASLDAKISKGINESGVLERYRRFLEDGDVSAVWNNARIITNKEVFSLLKLE